MPTVAAPLPDLILYSRPGCHLCDEAREAIEAVLADRRTRDLAVPSVVEIDIESDPELHRRFLERIPVVELAGSRIELIVTVGKLRRVFADVLDGARGDADPEANPA
jgi:Glutaredoxin-like domain (DUF836)